MKISLSSLVIPLIFLAASPVSAQFLPEKTLFGSPTDFAKPHTADINSDGYTDLVSIRNSDNRAILWYLNDGTGHFPVEPSDSIVLHAPDGIMHYTSIDMLTAADFNGDSFIDLAVIDIVDNGIISWFAGDGQGHFVKHLTGYSDGNHPLAFRPVDVDQDGDQDLVLSQFDAGPTVKSYIRWIRNDGNGNFSTPVLMATYNSDVTDIIISDLNHDGKPDVLIPSQLTWFLNYSSGSFQSKPLPALAQNLFGIADMDGDGDNDLLAAGAGGLIYLLRNTASPMNAVFTQVELPVDNHHYYNILFVSDMDGDGDKDMIYNASTWLENDGLGQFTLQYNYSDYYFYGETSFELNGLDLNNDGREEALFFSLDFIGQAGLSSESTVATEMIVPDLQAAYSVLPFDFDADGDLDMVVGSDKLYWFANIGGGQYGSRQDITPLPYNTSSFQFADIDGDSDQDIFTYSIFENLMRNLGFGYYSQPTILPFTGHSSLLLRDFDADGDIDILGGYLPVTFLRNVGNGNFDTSVTFGECSAGWSATVDMDGDSDLDLAVACDYGVSILKNDGAANFSSAQELALPAYARHCWWADIDGSGKLDVVVTTNGEIGWFPRLPNGSFDTWHLIFKPANSLIDPDRTHFADLDGDGDVDMILTVGYGTTMMKNDGAGNFKPFLDLPYFSQVTPFDVDNDHDLDLLYASGTVGWHENVSAEAYIGGTCFWDKNENNQRDPGEPPFQNQILHLEPAGKLSFTDEDGNFRFYADSGHYALSIMPDSCWVLSTDSAAYHFFFDGANAQLNLDFGLKLDGTRERLGAEIATGPTRCGFEVPCNITLRNKGCALASPLFELYLDSLTTFISATPAPNSVTAEKLTWQPTDTLYYSDLFNIQMVLKIAGPEHLGDTIRLLGVTRAVDTLGNPVGPADSTFLLSQINCAYDPNDKLVSRSKLPTHYDAAASELIYTIRFQNTGTDTAFNINIHDRLAPELDWSTFRPLGASHPFSARFDSATQIVIFSFKNILLPDSTVNEIGSHGLLQFAIYPVAGLPAGTVIKNQAGIYFDFNPPIATNIAETIVETPVSTHQPTLAQEKIQLWPNPGAGAVFLEWGTPMPENGGRLLLTDLTGKPLRDKQLPTGATRCHIDFMDLPPGFYLLNLQAEGCFWQIEKLIKSN